MLGKLTQPNRLVLVLLLTLGLVPGLSQSNRSAISSIQAQVYSYDFDDGSAGWDLEAGIWFWVPSGGGHALFGSGHGFARLTAHSGEVSALTFKFRLEDLNSQFHANLLESFTGGHTRYAVRFQSNGVVLSKQITSNFQELGMGFAPIAPDVFHEAQILVGGGSIDVFVDGEGVVGVDDPNPPPPGFISFESLDDSGLFIDNVEVQIGPEPAPHSHAPRPPLSFPPGPNVGPFVNGIHNGSFTLSGGQVLTLSQGRYTVTEGEINLTDDARLRIESGAVLVFDRGNSPLFHWGINMQSGAVLEVDGGNIVPAGNALIRINAFGTSSIRITNAKPWIHFINAGDNATVYINNSRFATDIGGSIQLNDSVLAEIQDSKVGAIALFINAGSSLTASNLRPGVYSNFDLQNDLVVSGISYNLRLINSEIVPDTIGEGPFERGWVIFADETAHVNLSNSTLRKMNYQFPASGPDRTISNLKLNQPTNLTIGNVIINNVTVTGQWGFFIYGSRKATFKNCDALWFFPYDNVDILLENSVMNEFDPRSYTGTFTFDNGEWKMTGEIINWNLAVTNDFLMAGTYTVDPDLKQSLSWSQSAVTRRYPILVLDSMGDPLPGATLTFTRGTQTINVVTGINGKASVDLRFTDSNYTQPWQLTSSLGGSPRSVDFFSSTPIILGEFHTYLPLTLRNDH
jgi:hypothetical protein